MFRIHHFYIEFIYNQPQKKKKEANTSPDIGTAHKANVNIVFLDNIIYLTLML